MICFHIAFKAACSSFELACGVMSKCVLTPGLTKSETALGLRSKFVAAPIGERTTDWSTGGACMIGSEKNAFKKVYSAVALSMSTISIDRNSASIGSVCDTSG